MSAKEYYLTKEWGNPNWDRKTATTFDKSEMFDFAESYAREYHQKEMERELEESEGQIEKALKETSTHVFYEDGWKDGAKWALNHLKQRKG